MGGTLHMKTTEINGNDSYLKITKYTGEYDGPQMLKALSKYYGKRVYNEFDGSNEDKIYYTVDV